MNNEKSKITNSTKPIEKHETAAWADIERMESEARVPIPSEEAVNRAKDWVDENEK